tara:strand:- start:340 stop:558 length:219 start_codon:yes stop_codon:yes gene_type:complete
MSGFKGFTNDPNKDGNVRFEINADEVSKLIKKYKKIKKFQKSNIAEVSKLSGIETNVDRLIKDYGIDSEAIE